MIKKNNLLFLSFSVLVSFEAAAAGLRGHLGAVDLGMLRPAIVNGAPVGEDQPMVLAMTAMLSQVRISKEAYLALSDEERADAYVGRCTGTVIAPDVILSAAHCFDKNQHVDVSWVYVQGQEYRVKAVSVYYKYDPKVYDHDIALLFLKEPIKNAQTALLPEPWSMIPDNTDLLVAGFGMTGPYLAHDKVMRFVNMKGSENGRWGITARGDQTICSGDSGGPAYMVHGARLMVVGVTATGDCKSVANFTRVSEYLDWIQGEIRRIRSQLDI